MSSTSIFRKVHSFRLSFYCVCFLKLAGLRLWYSSLKLIDVSDYKDNMPVLLDPPEGCRRPTYLMVKHHRKLEMLMYILGLVWFFALPSDNVSSGNYSFCMLFL